MKLSPPRLRLDSNLGTRRAATDAALQDQVVAVRTRDPAMLASAGMVVWKHEERSGAELPLQLGVPRMARRAVARSAQRLPRTPRSAQTRRNDVLPGSCITNERCFAEDAAVHRSASGESGQNADVHGVRDTAGAREAKPALGPYTGRQGESRGAWCRYTMGEHNAYHRERMQQSAASPAPPSATPTHDRSETKGRTVERDVKSARLRRPSPRARAPRESPRKHP